MKNQPMSGNILAQYLRQAEERFSGFAGNDYSNIMRPDDMNAIGEGAAALNEQIKTQATPYKVKVENTTAGTLSCVLFGRNKYLLTTNYGSATGLVVTATVAGMTYLEILQQSAEQPFETSLIKVKSSTTNQPTQEWTITSKDANGQQVTIPLDMDSFFSANQYQGSIVDAPYNLRIDGNTYVTFDVLANATVYLTFWPKAKINIARGIQGDNSRKDYNDPNIPIGNTLVVKQVR